MLTTVERSRASASIPSANASVLRMKLTIWFLPRPHQPTRRALRQHVAEVPS